MQILLQISQQLGSLSVNSGLINSTFAPADLAPFTPTTSSVLVNAFWFMALALSLISASLGMLVKQWLREYMAITFVSPKQRCEVRWFRRMGLLRYKVPEIIAVLPLLLQHALILFFIGLILFIQPINSSIATAVIVVVSFWFSFLAVTTFIPLLSPSCPYKNPFLKDLFRRFRDFLQFCFDKAGLEKYFLSWDPFRKIFVEEPDMSQWTYSRDVNKVLLDAYDTFKDPDVWEMITRCIDLDRPLMSILSLTTQIQSINGSSIAPWSPNFYSCGEAERRALMKSYIACFRKVFWAPVEDPRSLDLQHALAQALYILRQFAGSLSKFTEMDKALSRMTDQILQRALSSNLPVASPHFVAGTVVYSLREVDSGDLPQITHEGA